MKHDWIIDKRGKSLHSLIWSPEGRVFQEVWARSAAEAKKQAIQPYRQYMSEIYVKKVEESS